MKSVIFSCFLQEAGLCSGHQDRQQSTGASLVLPALRLPLSASLSGDKASRAVWAPVTREKIIKKMTLVRPWKGQAGGDT